MTAPPFEVRDLGEVAIRCADIDAMFAFYRDIVGLAVLAEPDGGIAFFRIAPGYAGHTRVLALFGVDAGDPRLHARGTALPATGAGSSLHHVALNIDFAAQDAAVAWLRGHGVATEVQVFGWVGWRGVFFADPEGNTVELVAHHPSLEAGA